MLLIWVASSGGECIIGNYLRIFTVLLLLDIDVSLCCRQGDYAFPFPLAKILGYFATIEYYMYNTIHNENMKAFFPLGGTETSGTWDLTSRKVPPSSSGRVVHLGSTMPTRLYSALW